MMCSNYERHMETADFGAHIFLASRSKGSGMPLAFPWGLGRAHGQVEGRFGGCSARARS